MTSLLRPRVAALLGVSLAVAAGLLVAHAQVRDQRDTPPLFRAGAAFVTVDVYPRQDGRIVEGLTTGDFQLFEDGKPQPIETFDVVTFDPLTPDADRRDPNTAAEGARAARDPRNRVFVVYLDPFHTSLAASREGPGAVGELLRRGIGPTDVFAVMTPELPVDRLTFGRRTDTVEAELRQYWTWGEEGRGVFPRTEAERNIIRNCMRSDPPDFEETVIRLYREDLLMTSLEHLMQALQALRDGRKNVLLLSEGWVPQPPRADLAAAARTEMPRIGTGPGGRIGINPNPGAGPMQRDQSVCSGLLLRLAGIDFERRFREFVDLAMRSNVTFYPIDLGGLKGGLGGRQQVLRILAENTDGLAVVNTNDLPGGARRIADAQSSYYLLGYYSTNTNNDGQYRRIEVKVTKPGVSVAARPGYVAPTAEAFSRWSAPPVAMPGVDVSDAIGRMAATRPEAELLASGSVTTDGLDVVVELPARTMVDRRWAAGADVSVTATAAPDATATASGRLEPGTRAVLVHVPLSAPAQGPWQVRVRAVAPDAIAEERLQITSEPDGAWLGRPRLLRAGPSVRQAPRPTADLDFRRTERLVLEVPIRAGAAQPEARVLDRRGQPLAIAAALSQTMRGDEGMWQITLAVAALADGEYVIQATAGETRTRDQRLVAFRVVR